MFGPNFMAIHPRFHSRIKKVKLVVAREKTSVEIIGIRPLGMMNV